MPPVGVNMTGRSVNRGITRCVVLLAVSPSLGMSEAPSLTRMTPPLRVRDPWMDRGKQSPGSAGT